LAQVKILDFGDLGQDNVVKEALEAIIIDEVHPQSQRFERTAAFNDSLSDRFETLGSDSIVTNVKKFERFVHVEKFS